MRLVIDACLPHWLVECLAPIAEPQGYRVDHVTRLYGEGCKDVDWIGRLTADGGAVFLTLDGQMKRRPIEVQALIASSCVGIVLAPGWQNDDDHELAGRLLFHWSLIQEAGKLSPPQLLQLPWTMHPRTPGRWRGWDKVASRIALAPRPKK